jgi:putative transposase
MLVFLAKNNKLTSKDRLGCFKKHSQTGKLFVTSDLDLTTKEEDFAGWWKEFAEENSQKLWLPTKTDSYDLDLISSNKSAKSTEYQSWFGAKQKDYKMSEEVKKSSKKISSASLTSLSPGETGLEPDNSKKPEPNSLRKVRIFPTEAQKSKLRQVFQANRWAWNVLVENTKNDIFNNDVKVNDLKKSVRSLVQKKTMVGPERICQVPEEVFDSAYRDLWKARSAILAASAAKKKRTGTGFCCKSLKFRKRKMPTNSIELRSRGIKVKDNGIVIWPRFMGRNEILQIKEAIPSLHYSCRLQLTRSGEYYLCIPEYKEKKCKRTGKTCAIDPGVRTMLTGYDPDGFIFELGLNMDVIVKRWMLADRLQSKLRKFKGRRNTRYNLKKQQLGILAKIKRMMKDCHHKISKWISERYDQVLLPKFETGEMVRKFNRLIGRETARKMLGWSHWSFKELLRHKMEMKGGKLLDCTEEYTSKTCTVCGRLNHCLGALKIFCCPFNDCKTVIDRDVGAARNIYLKNSHLFD